jgi:hypothetical protein
MVKQSLFYTAILLLIYTFGLRYIPFERNIPLNVQQSKYLTVENFLYGQQKNNMPFSVIVGSSMAEKLSTNRLPTSVINLSMNGGMSLTGLQLLEKSKRIPIAIYVELNVLTRKEDSTLLACFDNTWLQKQKEILPFLQERNQPATILLNAYNVVRPVTKKRPIVST